MPTIIDRKALPEKVWSFLKQTENKIEDDHMVISRDGDKLVVEPLTSWLEKGKTGD